MSEPIKENPAEAKTGFFRSLKKGLSKTRNSLAGGFDNLVHGKATLGPELVDEIEEAMLVADVGVKTTQFIVDELNRQIGDARILVIGMGRVGTSAYDELRRQSGQSIVGLDFDEERVGEHERAGRTVVLGDATDSDFWDRTEQTGEVSIVILTMSDHAANLDAAARIAARFAARGRVGIVAATARHPDEVNELKSAGVHVALDFYDEAGAGFAEHVADLARVRGLLGAAGNA